MNHTENLSDVEIAEFIKALRSSADKHASSLQVIEDQLGIEAGFIQRLMDESDDWAFIIKTSVVVESALGKIISASLLSPKLDRHIRTLPMDGRTGKIQLAQDLNLVSSSSAARLRAISDIRNDFAHGLNVLSLSLPDYFENMPSADFELLVKRLFSKEASQQDETSKGKAKRKSGSGKNENRDGRIGRYLVWTGACVALLGLANTQRQIDSEATWRSALMTLGQAFLARQSGNETTAREHMREALNTLKSQVATRTPPSTPGFDS